MKTVTIEAFLPELTGGKCYLSAVGRAASVPQATHNAIEHLLADPKVGKKRITTIKATISIATWTEDLSGPRSCMVCGTTYYSALKSVTKCGGCGGAQQVKLAHRRSEALTKLRQLRDQANGGGKNKG